MGKIRVRSHGHESQSAPRFQEKNTTERPYTVPLKSFKESPYRTVNNNNTNAPIWHRFRDITGCTLIRQTFAADKGVPSLTRLFGVRPNFQTQCYDLLSNIQTSSHDGPHKWLYMSFILKDVCAMFVRMVRVMLHYTVEILSLFNMGSTVITI